MSVVDEARKKLVLDLAYGEGIKWGVLNGLVAGIATGVASIKSERFNRGTSVSAKTAIPVMTAVFSWSLAFEMTMNSAHRFPERWGLEEKKEESKKGPVLPFHHWVVNTLYGNEYMR